MDYKSAMSKLKTARRIEDGKPIDRNTRLIQRGECVAVRLHETDVVTFYPDGSVRLNTGGWKTVTTKDRINNYSPFQVWSRKGCWLVNAYGKEFVFADGMTIAASGDVQGAAPAGNEKAEKLAREEAKRYAVAFVDALYGGQIHPPSAGDCMMCRVKEMGGDAEHIRSHIQEGYYVPSLLTNAMSEFGASKASTQTAWAFMEWHPKIESLGEALAHEHGKPPGAYSTDRNSFVADGIEKCLRRYILRRQGIAT